MIKLRLILLLLAINKQLSAETINCEFFDYNCYQKMPERVWVDCYTCYFDMVQIPYDTTSVQVNTERNYKTSSAVLQVEIQNSTLSFLPQQIFQAFPQLEAVGVHYSVLKTMTTDFLKNGYKLKYLNCNYNDLTRMDAYTFRSSNKLEHLSFGWNRLHQIHKDAFSGLRRLTYLDLNNNRLVSVDPLLFRDLRELQILYLYENQIDFIEPNTFVNNNKITLLAMQKNRIRAVSSETFNGLVDIKQLFMDDNQIKVLNAGTFGRLTKLEYLCLFQNKIESIDRFAFEGASNLQKMYLFNNKIARVPTQTFASLTKMKDLSLKGNVCINQSFTNSRDVTKALEKVCQVSNVPLKEPPKQVITHKIIPSKEVVPPNISVPNKNNRPEAVSSKIQCPSNEIVGHTMDTQCTLHGAPISCEESLVPQTEVNTKCKLGFQSIQNRPYSRSNCLEDGTWDKAAVQCHPGCGLSISRKASPLLVGGVSTNNSMVPWHVAVYEMDEFICGGSIITSKLVISAAHCFYRDLPNSGVKLERKERFKIVAGKYFRELNKEEPLKTQTFNVEDIKGLEGYNGYRGNFVADIAIVVLDKNIRFNSHISPICLDYDSNLQSQSKLPVGKNGKLAGWGWTEFNGSISDELKTLDMPVVSLEDCKKEADDFIEYITPDKICAGSPGFSACKGDSGGGLVVSKNVGGSPAYYLRGIVSNSRLVPNGCDTVFYTMFINVHSYIGFVQETVKAYTPR